MGESVREEERERVLGLEKKKRLVVEEERERALGLEGRRVWLWRRKSLERKKRVISKRETERCGFWLKREGDMILENNKKNYKEIIF